MEDSSFSYTAPQQRLLVRFPATRLVLLPIAPPPRSAQSLPEEPKTCPQNLTPKPVLKKACADGLTMFAVEWALDAGWTSRCQRAKSLHPPIRRSHAMCAGGGQVFPARPR
jgi:hypothetical protein